MLLCTGGGADRHAQLGKAPRCTHGLQRLSPMGVTKLELKKLEAL